MYSDDPVQVVFDTCDSVIQNGAVEIKEVFQPACR